MSVAEKELDEIVDNKESTEKEEEKERTFGSKKEKEDGPKKRDALVTSRILFISVLDKIYIIVLLLYLVMTTFLNFKGDITSVSYGFWGRVLDEIFILIGFIITYFICNWFYKCFAKTMICVTEKEIYRESYLPLLRTESTIPLNRITNITAYKCFWIFRALIIFQYHRLPIIFFTWNNQEFKDKVEELLTDNNTKVKNEFESKNIINKGQYKFVAIGACVLVAIISILGIARFFGYMFSEERNIPGKYSYKSNYIELDKDGTCELKVVGINNVTSCDWEYDTEHKRVDITYEYEYKGYYSFYSSKYTSTISLDYEDKALKYNNSTFEKD